MGIVPRRPSVQGAVQDVEGVGDALAVHACGGGSLAPHQGVGHQFGNLEQTVGAGVSEDGAADYPGDGQVAGVPAVATGADTDGHRVVAAQPFVSADHHLVGFLPEDEEGVAAVVVGGGVDAVEEAVQGYPAVRRRFVHVQANVDNSHAAGLHGKVLDDAQSAPDDLRRLTGCGLRVAAAATGRGGGRGAVPQFAGMQPTVGRNAVALFQVPAPVTDAAVKPVPGPSVHAQGGKDVAAADLGLHHVVDFHGFLLVG